MTVRERVAATVPGLGFVISLVGAFFCALAAFGVHWKAIDTFQIGVALGILGLAIG